jgi:hypothetical protein
MEVTSSADYCNNWFIGFGSARNQKRPFPVFNGICCTCLPFRFNDIIWPNVTQLKGELVKNRLEKCFHKYPSEILAAFRLLILNLWVFTQKYVSAAVALENAR